ncbi:MAG: hypothetical protein L3J06_06305 [Cyclobacteriaceae bacterium]|nr:hypothetical protein [Cyclobacteriaceae bacterium]
MKLYKFFHIIFHSILFIGCLNGYGQHSKNNPHKFSTANWEFTEWCNPCHIYDSKKETSDGEFLLSYESDSITSTDSTYLSGISKLCFSCHDGTVAQFSHSANLSLLKLSAGGRVKNAHPVSVFYATNGQSNLKLYNPKTTLSGLGDTIAEDMLKNGRVECTSCHDAHFSMQTIPCSSCPTTENSNQQTSNKVNSLLITLENGALCLTCHDL